MVEALVGLAIVIFVVFCIFMAGSSTSAGEVYQEDDDVYGPTEKEDD